jgi:hypothetical protein
MKMLEYLEKSEGGTFREWLPESSQGGNEVLLTLGVMCQ